VRLIRIAVPLLLFSLLAVGCGVAAAPSRLTPVWAERYVPNTLQVAGVPTIGGGRIVVSGPTGDLTAFDLSTGRQLWQRQVVPDTSVLPGPPLIVGSSVLVMAGTELGAYALTTGAPLWHTAPRGLSLGSPQLLPSAGLIVLPAAGLPLYDAADGRLVRLLAPGLHPHPTTDNLAVVGSDLLVVTAGGTVQAYDGSGRLLWTAAAPPVSAAPGQTVHTALVGVDTGSGGVALAMEGVSITCPTCVQDGTVQAVGLAWATGRVLWTQSSGSDLPVVAAAGVPVAVEAGQGVAVSLSDGRVLWRLQQQSDRFYTSLQLAQGRLLAYDPGHGTLLLVDPRTGRIIARQSVPYAAGLAGVATSRPQMAVGGGYVVVTTSDGHLAAFRLG